MVQTIDEGIAIPAILSFGLLEHLAEMREHEVQHRIKSGAQCTGSLMR